MGLKPGAVTIRNSLVIASVAAVIVLTVVGAAFIALGPPADFFRIRSAPKTYEKTRLEDVLRDLEGSKVIPAGTSWEKEALKDKRVTVRWSTPTDWETLYILAKKAGVEIHFPVSVEGRILGPVSIRSAPFDRGRLVPHGPGRSVPPKPAEKATV
ncbi:MAG: hypothetical protein P8Z49_00700 [Acidobacteriota bacterium]